MNKRAILFTLLALSLMSISSHAQETKTVSENRKNEYFTISEKFSVLKSNPEIKHGPYGASISSYSEKGQFEQGKKTGVWECYSRGKMVQKYDFSTQTFLVDDGAQYIASVTQLDEHGNAVKELGPRSIYFGGNAKIGIIMVKSIRYPAAAQERDIQGRVFIEAKLDKQGRLSEQKTVSTNGYGLEEEGMRVFKLLPPDWVPVLVDGKPVDVRIQFKMTFGLSHLPPLKD